MEKGNITLEILIHFLDTEGNRTKPSCNRIRIPLQVSEITAGESAIMPLQAVRAVTSYLQNHEVLHRLFRKSKEKSNSIFQLVCFPVLDSIEIQEKK